MRRVFRPTSGFSVLELVSVLAIVFLVAALAIPQINRYWQFYRLDAATQTLASNLATARYSAVARNLKVAVGFFPAAGVYELFEDGNANGVREATETLLGSYALAGSVGFSGAGLLGPPSNPSGPVGDPITFDPDRVLFNPLGKLDHLSGTVYLQNGSGEATAITINSATGRMKTYKWDKSTSTWK